MLFRELEIAGAYVVEPEPIRDHRGFNARTWCTREFEERGLNTRIVQTNILFNHSRGTLRGMHYQAPPMAESKLFRVTRGAVYDVILDLRPKSPTYRQWTSLEIEGDSYRMLYIPEGVAQGFVTLEDATELTYQVSMYHSPEHGRGVRYNDPAFGIEWPIELQVISEKDLNWPDYDPDR